MMKSSEGNLHKKINLLNDRINQLENQLADGSGKVLKDGVQIEFLAQMSHELRTPVNILLNAVDMLREDYIKDPDDYAREILNILDSAGKRIHRTIDLFVHLMELHTGKYTYDKTHFDLYGDIKNALEEQFKAEADEKDLGFYWTEEGSDHLIESDAYAVTQIFIQLIENAIKFTNFGKVEINVKKINGKHSFTVYDTGVGIKEEYLKKVFDPFLQEDRGYSRKFEGNGLGLTIAKQFADLVNARISVESEKGVGSTFTVEFID